MSKNKHVQRAKNVIIFMTVFFNLKPRELNEETKKNYVEKSDFDLRPKVFFVTRTL